MNHYHNEEDWNHENSPVINHSVLNKVLEFMSMGTNGYKKSMGAKRVQLLSFELLLAQEPTISVSVCPINY